MEAPHRALRDPATVPALELVVPDTPDLTFAGWAPEAFTVLDRLRAHPHIDQYRKEKEGGDLARLIKEPFKRYRDDLVVNFVLPNRLDWETEKNVFSRLLKNDFGAGGCHHHKWMAFYRPGRRRLTDVQLSHSLSPDGLDIGLFVGGYAKELVAQAMTRIGNRPERFLALVDPLLERPGWRLAYAQTTTRRGTRVVHEAPLGTVPNDLTQGKSLWVRRLLPREEVVSQKGDVLRLVLDTTVDLWPLYRFYLTEGEG